MKNPTIEMTETLQSAYDFFNDSLFNGYLPACMITLNRKRTSKGYFSKNRFENRSNNHSRVHEIALNPDTFTDRSDTEILSTLVHEMCHCWQEEFGINKAKGAYHNNEWVSQMKNIGLKPYSETTGDRGTGTKVTHSIMPFGKFESFCNEFLRHGHKINYQSEMVIKETAPRKKHSYSFKCPKCGDYAKSHKNRKLVCGDCIEIMKIEDD